MTKAENGQPICESDKSDQACAIVQAINFLND